MTTEEELSALRAENERLVEALRVIQKVASPPPVPRGTLVTPAGVRG